MASDLPTLEDKGEISKDLIAKYLPDNPVIVEAGAKNGNDTREMSDVWPNASIYTFEPVPHLFNQLISRVKGKKNVFCFNSALGSETGSTIIHISSGRSEGSSSLLPPKEHLDIHPDVKFEKTLTVPVENLDEWADKNKISKIDLLWLDLQGLELSVMKSAPNVMQSVSVVYTEVFLKELYENAPLYPELKEWMVNNGFIVAAEALPWDDSGNVLFIRK